MTFEFFSLSIKPTVGRPMSLGGGGVDSDTLTLTFHYQEQAMGGHAWCTVEHEQALAEGEHYNLDARSGTVTLLDHPFWYQESTWREGGAYGWVEPLLYQGRDGTSRVKHPQYIRVEFERYIPTPVEPGAKVDWNEVNQEAKRRLGYDVLEYRSSLQMMLGTHDG
jgi:hypothetical protein